VYGTTLNVHYAQLMTFDKVDTMIYQPKRSDNYRD
jgi:hypothetical protein